MFRSLTTYLTIAALLACPLICSGQAVPGEEAPARSSCCSRCHKTPDSDSKDRPDQPTDGCQCLCKGAIGSKPVSGLSQDASAALATPACGVASVLLLAACVRAAEGWSPLLTTGRMLRLEHCSLRC